MGISVLTIAMCLLGGWQGEGAGGTRQIIPEEFVKARPARTTSKTPARKPVYRPATKSTALPAGNPGEMSQVGLTIWRLRPATDADGGTRIIVQQDEGETVEWSPERVEANTPMRVGERIRFSFESPQEGYLYVIDREQFGNGEMGEPYLIFPTTRTRGGDNKVAPGKLIEIPGQDDRPNFFTLRKSRLDQTGEQLTMLITNQPLEGISIGPKALKLSNEQVAQWEKNWGTRVERFEMVNGQGKGWTRAEQEAGADATRALTQDDPGPQTIYRVAVKPGSPILVNVGLRYGQPPRKSGRK